MRCPRCEARLVTFAFETNDESAVVCESCGFAGIPASHRTDSEESESWDQVLARFDDAVLPPERTCRTERSERVQTPTDDDQT
jgi:hypothetical protein